MEGENYPITELILNFDKFEQGIIINTTGKIERIEKKLTKANKPFVNYYVTDGLNTIRGTDFSPNGMTYTEGDSVDIVGKLNVFKNIPYINVVSISKCSRVIEKKAIKPRLLNIKTILSLISKDTEENFIAKTEKNYVRFTGKVISKKRLKTVNRRDYIEYIVKEEECSLTCRDFDIVNEVSAEENVQVDGFVQIFSSQPGVLIETIQSTEQDYVASVEDFEFQEGEEDIAQDSKIRQVKMVVLENIEEEKAYEEIGKLDKKNSFQMIINEDLLEKLEKLSKEDKKRFSKAVYNIKHKNWKSGVKVKKLSGISEPVYEGRLDRDRRILFQIKRIPVEDTMGTEQTIVLQDIVRHKKITEGANNIIRSQVERLNLQIYNRQLIGEAVKEQEVYSVDEIDESFLNFDEREIDEDSTGLPNGIKHYRFDNEIIEEYINGIPRKLLALSPKQQEMVFKYGPLLINGGAGTGKTTVLSHVFLFKHLQKEEELIYITLTESLRNYIRSIIEGMIKQDDESKENMIRRIITFNQLCKNILKSEQEDFKEENEIRVFDFIEWIRRRRQYRNYDPLKLWQEYFGVIKGSCESSDKGIITLKEYIEKGNKVSLFQKEERQSVYEIIKKYHKEMREKRYWDSLDIAQRALQKMKKKKLTGSIKGVICDEIQDFVEVQYSIFLEILTKDSYNNLFFGGDILQSINSSNFRWDDLKKFLHNNLDGYSVNDTINMNRNFRSTSKMIDIANRFIELKKELGIHNTEDVLQKATDDLDTRHSPGMLINQDDEELFNLLENLGHVKDRFIIVYGEKSREILMNYFDKNFIFTVAEAKGLEFLTTFLFNLATDTDIDWKKFFGNNSTEYIEKNRLLIKYAFNRIYVALTRARRHIIVYESDDDAFELWKRIIGSSLKLTSLNFVERYWTEELTEEQLLQNAEYFKLHKRYALAADYFHRCNELNKAIECEALDAREKKDYAKAAELFENLGMDEEAAKDFEHCDLDKAEALYRSMNSEKGIGRCQARKYEKGGEYDRAGRQFEEIGEYHDAVEAFKMAKNSIAVNRNQALLHEHYEEFDKAYSFWMNAQEPKRAKHALAKDHVSSERYKEAAEIFEEIAKWKQAAKYWNMIGQLERATYCEGKFYQQEERYDDADMVFKELGNWDERVSMWSNIGKYDKAAKINLERAEYNPKYYAEAAKLWMRGGQNDEALEIVDKVQDLDTQVEIFSTLQMHDRVAKTYEDGGHFNLAGDNYLKADDQEAALRCYKLAKNTRNTAELLMDMEKWDEAAELFWEIEEWDSALACNMKIGDHSKVAECYEKMEQWKDAGHYYLKVNEKDKAISVYKEGKFWEKVANIYKQMEKWEEAAQYYEQAMDIRGGKKEEMAEEAGEAWNNAGNREKAKELLKKGKRENKLLLKLWEEDGDWGELARHYSMKDKQKSAQYYEKAGIIDKAVEMYESAKKYEEAIKLLQEKEPSKKLAILYTLNRDHASAAQIYEKIKEWNEAAQSYTRANEETKRQIRKRTGEINEKWKKEAKDKSALAKKKLKELLTEELSPLTKLRKKYGKKIISCYEKADFHLKAAAHAKEEGLLIKAAECYERVGKFEEAAELYHKRKRYIKAAETYKKGRLFKKAAKCYEIAAENSEKESPKETIPLWEEAARAWEEEKEWENALRIWKERNRMDRIAMCYEKLGKKEEAAKAWHDCAKLSSNSKHWGYAAKLYEKLGDNTRAVLCYENAGMEEKVDELTEDEEGLKKQLDKYTKKGNTKKMAEINEKLGNIKDAAELWENLEKNIRAAKLWEKLGEKEKVKSLLEKHPKELAEFYKREELWVKAAENYKKAKKYEEAATCYNKAGMMEKVKELKKLHPHIFKKKRNKKRDKRKKSRR